MDLGAGRDVDSDDEFVYPEMVMPSKDELKELMRHHNNDNEQKQVHQNNNNNNDNDSPNTSVIKQNDSNHDDSFDPFAGEEEDGILFFHDEDGLAPPTDEQGEEMFVHNRINEEVLTDIAQTQDLSQVSHIQLQVNVEAQGLDDLGHFLPALQELKLDNSYLTSLRDIGPSQLRNLRILFVGQCGLRDLDGVEILAKLEQLHLPYNSISALDAIYMHEHLELIDLHHNRISDPDTVEFLGASPTLTYVKLSANPLCARVHYRTIVVQRIPSLQRLDDADVTPTERKHPQLTEQQELQVDQEKKKVSDQQLSLNVTPLIASDITEEQDNDKAMVISPRRPPTSGSSRGSTGYGRPSTAQRVNSLDEYYSRPWSGRSTNSALSTPSTPPVFPFGNHSEYLDMDRSENNSRGSNVASPYNTPSFFLDRGSSPSSARRPQSARWLPRPSSSAAAPQRHSESNGASSSSSEAAASSDLTYGHEQALSGNFIQALRSRKRAQRSERKQQQPSSSSTTTTSTAAAPVVVAEDERQPQQQQPPPVLPHRQRSAPPTTSSSSSASRQPREPPIPSPQKRRPSKADAKLRPPPPSSSSVEVPVSSLASYVSLKQAAGEPVARWMRHVSYEGHLYKKGSSGSWNKRYFALVSGACVYVKNVQDFWENGKVARIQLSLKPSELQPQQQGYTPGNVKNVFTVSSNDQAILGEYAACCFSVLSASVDGCPAKKHLVAAPDVAEKEAWMQRIAHLVNHARRT